MMTEDDVYRASTQYRLWSFTPESISAQRMQTNALAAEGVRAAIRNSHSSRAQTNSSEGDDSGIDGQANQLPEIDCLSVEEEQKLVGYYCIQAIKLADFCNFPTNVKVILLLCFGQDYSLTIVNCGRLQRFSTLNAFTCPTPP